MATLYHSSVNIKLLKKEREIQSKDDSHFTTEYRRILNYLFSFIQWGHDSNSLGNGHGLAIIFVTNLSFQKKKKNKQTTR